MQAILHWNYASISRYDRHIYKKSHFSTILYMCYLLIRGNNSLLGKLREAKIDPLNYISFYGLRTHSQLNRQLV